MQIDNGQLTMDNGQLEENINTIDNGQLTMDNYEENTKAMDNYKEITKTTEPLNLLTFQPLNNTNGQLKGEKYERKYCI